MTDLIAYVQGPMSRNEGGFMGIGGKKVIYYQMNPQLYLDYKKNPINNFGVFNIEFDQQPTKEDLETRLKECIKSILGTGVQFEGIIIPIETINIKIENED